MLSPFLHLLFPLYPVKSSFCLDHTKFLVMSPINSTIANPMDTFQFSPDFVYQQHLTQMTICCFLKHALKFSLISLTSPSYSPDLCITKSYCFSGFTPVLSKRTSCKAGSVFICTV